MIIISSTCHHTADCMLGIYLKVCLFMTSEQCAYKPFQLSFMEVGLHRVQGIKLNLDSLDEQR